MMVSKLIHTAVTVLFIQLIFIQPLLAFDGPVTKHLGIEQGLSNNSVRSIYQDHHGFMWFGTFDGLNRYDGYEFKIFRNKLNDGSSLPHNYINTINEDQDNNIWVGTGQGIGIYNNLTLSFSSAYCILNGTKKKEKIDFYINSIKTDKQGNVFIATNQGLLVQKKGTGVSYQLPCLLDKKQVCRKDVLSLAIGKDQRIWLSINNLGLCLFDLAKNQIFIVQDEIKNIRCIEPGEGNSLWLGTPDGVYQYDISLGRIVRSFREVSGALSSENVTSLCFDREGQLWIGTEGGGINKLNLKTWKVDCFKPGNNINNLSSETVNAIYRDREGRQWIGTQKGGIDIVDPLNTKFKTIAHDPFRPNSLIYNFVSSFYEDSNQNLWIGTDEGGLSVWNRMQNTFTNYDPGRSELKSTRGKSITSIREDYLHAIWIATFGSGINRFNITTGKFEHFVCINRQTGEESKNIWLLYEDKEKNFWAASYSGKLYRLSRSTNSFEVFSPELENVFALSEDRAGNLWAGNPYRLTRVDKSGQHHVHYAVDKPVRAIFEDSKGNFWLGTEGGGLVLFNRTLGKIVKRFTDAEGLCNNSILDILEDEQGHLWLSTFNGLSEFDPVRSTFRNYFQEDGLQSNQFTSHAALRLRSGQMVFGGIRGFNIFSPGDTQNLRQYPVLQITALRINNQQVFSGNSFVNTISGDIIKSLKIPFSKAAVSLEFAALEYSAPGKISYAYYLEGWDKDWTYSGKVRTANYTRLSEGNYVLHVKSTTTEGGWNPHEIALEIVVLPPWYRSWWAYGFYAIIIVAGVVFYHRYRSRQAKLRYEISLAKVNADREKAERENAQAKFQMKQSELERKDAELAREKAERETERVINGHEKEVNEKRLSFFTNISHEFRTPLTLVINPIKSMLAKKQLNTEDSRDELKTVYRNASRMLSLVDQLLLFRKAEAGADRLKITKLDLCNVSHEVYMSFTEQAKALEIDYEFDAPPYALEIYVDREKLEIILYNLLSNAFKYTPREGKIRFVVTEEKENVEVQVIDTGQGIPKEVGDKLFDRFYRVVQNETHAKAGFGIGLYLVKHFVETHKGSVSYQSEQGKGTVFFVKFRKGKEHLSGEPVFEDSVAESALLEEISGQVSEQKRSGSKGKKTELNSLFSENWTMVIVDDEPEMRDYVASIFAPSFIIYQAGDTEEAWDVINRYIPDIVISDINMRGKTGIDLCRIIKNNDSLSHIPVILLTGLPSTDTRLAGLGEGADDYITKPFESEVLLARVVNILKSRTSLQKYFYNEVTLQQNPFKVSAEYKEFLDKCIAIVEQHIDHPDFGIKMLSAELCISQTALYKKIKSISGQSSSAFIRFIRLRKVAELLINTNCNINEAATQVGFNDLKYFREQFFKLFGMRPSDYIKKYRKTFGKSYNFNDDEFKPEG